MCTRRSRRGVAHSVRNIGSARNRPERPIQARPSPGGAPAHRHQTPPKPTLGGFERGVTWQYRANRVVPQAVPHPYMMHMLGRGQWVRQGSMRSDARVSGEYATKKCGNECDDNKIPGLGSFWCELNTSPKYVTESAKEAFCNTKHFKRKCMRTCGECES